MLNLAEILVWLLTAVMVVLLLVAVVFLGHNIEKRVITDEWNLADFRRANANRGGPSSGAGTPLNLGGPIARGPARGPISRPGARGAPAAAGGEGAPADAGQPELEGPIDRGQPLDEDRALEIGGPSGDRSNVLYPETVIVPESLIQRYTNFQEAYQLVHEAASEMMPDGSLLVYDIQPGSLLETVVGLRSNDRVISVNGQPMPNDFSTSKSMFSELRNESFFQVEVERGGVRQVLSFQRQGR